MLIITIVLAVYYPTLFAQICPVDDLDAISGCFSSEHISLQDIFIPHSSGAGYYRPLIGLSYWLDKELWALDEHLMHFEGVLAHLLNGLLVFLVCREAIRLYLREQISYLPLLSSLLFSLHPLATESVNWISGRTDVMMSTFILISVYCLLRYQQTKSKIYVLFSFTTAFTALLAKESAFGFLIGLYLLITLPNDELPNRAKAYDLSLSIKLYMLYYVCAFLSALFIGSYWLVLLVAILYFLHIMRLNYAGENPEYILVQITRRFGLLLSVSVVAIGLAIILRKVVFSSSVGKIGQTITLMCSDLNYTISLFLGAIGFYVKKFFIPMPLNFFILEIDPLYDFIGIAVLLLVFLLLTYRTLPAIMAFIGICLVLPALPFAFGTIAWTAYAERYVYLANAFWIVSLCLLFGRYFQRDKRLMPYVTVATIIVCLLSAAATYARNVVWQTNVTLMSDTAEKSPKVRKLRDIYIRALLDAGQVDEAKQQYRLATESLPAPHFDDAADMMIGSQLLKENKFNEALVLYEKAIKRTQFSSERLLGATVDLLRKMKATEYQSMQSFSHLDALEKDYAQHLYRMTKDPARLIEAGMLAEQSGSFLEANNYLDAALRNAPQHDRNRLVVVVKHLREKMKGD